jgi:hypothetical protein
MTGIAIDHRVFPFFIAVFEGHVQFNKEDEQFLIANTQLAYNLLKLDVPFYVFFYFYSFTRPEVPGLSGQGLLRSLCSRIDQTIPPT